MTKQLPPRHPDTGRFITKEQPSKARTKPEGRATTQKQPSNKGGKK